MATIHHRINLKGNAIANEIIYPDFVIASISVKLELYEA